MPEFPLPKQPVWIINFFNLYLWRLFSVVFRLAAHNSLIHFHAQSWEIIFFKKHERKWEQDQLRTKVKVAEDQWNYIWIVEIGDHCIKEWPRKECSESKGLQLECEFIRKIFILTFIHLSQGNPLVDIFHIFH